MGEDEDRHPERRLVAPPATPVRIVGEVMESEHARAHDLGTNIFEIVLRIVVVDAGGPSPAGILEHALAERPGRGIGADEAPPVLAERVFGRLVRRCRETIERDHEIDTNCHMLSSLSGCTADPRGWLHILRQYLPYSGPNTKASALISLTGATDSLY